MRRKEISYKGQRINMVLMAGGSAPFKFKIYSTALYDLDAVMLQVGNKTFQHFTSLSPEYKMILDYVNLKYNFVIDQKKIRDDLEAIVRNVKALGTV